MFTQDPSPVSSTQLTPHSCLYLPLPWGLALSELAYFAWPLEWMVQCWVGGWWLAPAVVAVCWGPHHTQSKCLVAVCCFIFLRQMFKHWLPFMQCKWQEQSWLNTQSITSSALFMHLTYLIEVVLLSSWQRLSRHTSTQRTGWMPAPIPPGFCLYSASQGRLVWFPKEKYVKEIDLFGG